MYPRALNFDSQLKRATSHQYILLFLDRYMDSVTALTTPEEGTVSYAKRDIMTFLGVLLLTSRLMNAKVSHSKIELFLTLHEYDV